MANFVGPSHHLYYGALHRRSLWHAHLEHTFARYAALEWTVLQKQLNVRYRRMANRLLQDSGLGIQRPLALKDVLDDTPIDSFLIGLGHELIEYETELFTLVLQHSMQANLDLKWRKQLGKTSMLWGRELAQECLLSESMGVGALVQSASLKGLFELFQSVLQGGEFSWKSLLLRRYTDDTLDYELRECAHRRTTDHLSTDAVSKLACELEAKIFEGFSQALRPNVNFKRIHEEYCRDELKLQ